MGSALRFRFEAGLKVYVHRKAVDFRQSINGLSALVEQSLGLDPFAAAAYVFRNRRAGRIKILLWDRNGFWLLLKRLEKDRFTWPCCEGGIETTSAPMRIIPKGLLTESALSWCVTAKYQDGMPLYRLAALIHRFGGELSRATLAASVVRIGQAVQPIINLLRDHLLDASVLYGDETTVQVLKEPGRAAQSKSFLWAQMNGSGPPVRLFSYGPARSTVQAMALYAGSRPGAALMTDGYAPYDAVAERYGLVHLGCWAHARRYLVEAEQTPVQRQPTRATYSRPVLDELQTLLLQHLHSVLPQSLFGKALHYLHGL
jgi:transposase